MNIRLESTKERKWCSLHWLIVFTESKKSHIYQKTVEEAQKAEDEIVLEKEIDEKEVQAGKCPCSIFSFICDF